MRHRPVRSSSATDTHSGRKSWYIFFGGLISGLAIAVVVALYITHAPAPALTESLRSTAEQRSGTVSTKQNKVDNDALTPTDEPHEAEPPSVATNVSEEPQSIDALAQRETPPLAQTSQAAGSLGGTSSVTRYVLQIGAYTTAAEAERQKANLAMQGYETVISSYEVNKVLYYRLRIGPYNNMQHAEQMKAKLASAKINALLIKVEN
jgi:cell division protein FtsN